MKITSALTIDAILVPQGAEYRAVRRGLPATAKNLQVLPIPMGLQPLKRYLEQWKQTREFLIKPPTRLLLMGLGGSLSPQLKVGEIVLLKGCIYAPTPSETGSSKYDRNLSNLLYHRLPKKVRLVTGLSSDRIICSASEKLQLGQTYGADVVEMEGFAVLEAFRQAGIAVAMLRVISDSAEHNIPDLTSAFDSDGSLKPFPLAMSMLRSPIASFRLIQGSLIGLRKLQQVTAYLFASS